MAIKEIKIGEKYKLELLCIHNAGNVIMFETPTGDHLPFRESDLECVSHAAHKYDPCRLLRKGDKVQVKKRNGRCNGKEGEYLREAFCTVAEDEIQNELVRVLHNATEYRLDPAYLELVTPVEELEISRVFNDSKTGMWVVVKDNCTYACFPYRKKDNHKIANNETEAKKLAEDERDRLNAENRKEMEK